MAYLVLARKYRSLTFDQVVGQEHIAQTLVNAIKVGRVHHAYIFTGTRGVGKTTTARILAKALNCLNSDGPTTEPCNECDSCIAIGRGDDVDVIEIDGASNRGIDEIRELRANAIFRPSRSRYKVYYIDEVHMLTKEAFNALLKTLEEPPEHVKFIFATTEIEKLPATIVSRCQRFDFHDIPTAQIADHLKHICQQEGVTCEDDALFRIARAGAGSMRDGLSLLDQLLSGSDSVTDSEVVRILGTPPDERMAAIAEAIADGNTAVALAELAAILSSGVTLGSVTEALGEIFRNMMLAVTCGADSELIELPASQKQHIGELSKRFSVPTLVQSVGILQATGRNIRGSSLGRALLEAAIVRLSEADKFIDPESILERLQGISSSLPTGSGAGQKKKVNSAAGSTSAGYTPSSSPSSSPSRQSPAEELPSPAPEEIELQWNEAWLKDNWKRVPAALAAAFQGQVAGVMAIGTVRSFDGKVLTLDCPAKQEAVRRRGVESLAKQINQAISDLAGKPITVELLAGEGADASETVHKLLGGLSTAEKTEIGVDPSIKALTDLFGGEMISVKKESLEFAAVSDDEVADVDAEEEDQE